MSHQADRERLAHFNEQIDSLLSNPGGVTKAAVSDLQAGVSAFITHLEEHLRGEEDHILPSRKVMNIELQKQLVRRLWAATDAAKWETVLPFVILHLPRHVQRVKYIQAFTWAMPERAQQSALAFCAAPSDNTLKPRTPLTRFQSAPFCTAQWTLSCGSAFACTCPPSCPAACRTTSSSSERS